MLIIDQQEWAIFNASAKIQIEAEVKRKRELDALREELKTLEALTLGYSNQAQTITIASHEDTRYETLPIR
jgi:hypothetical protein